MISQNISDRFVHVTQSYQYQPLASLGTVLLFVRSPFLPLKSSDNKYYCYNLFRPTLDNSLLSFFPQGEEALYYCWNWRLLSISKSLQKVNTQSFTRLQLLHRCVWMLYWIGLIMNWNAVCVWGFFSCFLTVFFVCICGWVSWGIEQVHHWGYGQATVLNSAWWAVKGQRLGTDWQRNHSSKLSRGRSHKKMWRAARFGEVWSMLITYLLNKKGLLCSRS